MMQVARASLGVSGVFYVLFGLWWHLQVTKKFWSAQRMKTAFISTVTYPCCTRCKKCAVEGIVKLLSSIAVCAVCVVLLSSSSEAVERNEALGQLTVFVVFCLAGLCDIVSQSCPKFIFPNLDYLAMLLSFNLQSIVLAYHTERTDSWTGMVDTYAMIAATTTALAILLEVKFSGSLWSALLRAYSTVVLGTWLIHMVLYSLSNVPVSLVNINENATAQARNDSRTLDTELKFSGLSQDFEEDIAWVQILFSCHCGVALIILGALWLLTYCCANRNCCVCIPGEEDGIAHFENRVHFDYHVISRMTDSDFE